MQISIRADIKKATNQLSKIQRKQIPFATARALTQTAEFVAVNLNQDTKQYFDRPTPFTQRAFMFQRATKRRLVSVVMARRLQARYLEYQVFGGRREPKGRAIILPAGIKLNRYGNIPRNATRRLRARPDTFSATINGVPGLWQRTKQGLRLLVAYDSSAQYDPIFPFKRLSNQYVRKGFPVIFDRSLRAALRTAR